MKNIYKSLSIFLISTLITTAAFAQGGRPDPDKWTTIIAIGPFIAPEFEGANHYKVLPIPFIRASKGNYFIQTEGPGLTANVINNPIFNAGPSIQYRGERDEDVNSTLVSQLETINSSIEFGGFASYAIPLNNPGEKIEAKVKAMFDMGNAHKGYTVATSVSYSRIINRKIRLNLSLSTTYGDDNYNNTYFGINANNAVLGNLSLYTPNSGLKDIGGTINIGYSLNRNWGIIGLLGYKKLLNPAKNSPIIQIAGTTNQFIGTIGVSYRF